MRYLPHTPDDIQSMLDTVGVKDIDSLFTNVPDDVKLKEPLNLPDALSEWELNALMDRLSRDTAPTADWKLFLGAGCYDHYVPSAVSFLLSRSEFVTAYTPYQPEVSQGTLQGIYEYQTLVCRLLGMEVANGSMYDGASALAEALLMAMRITKKNRVAVSAAIHPLYRSVAKTYLTPAGFGMVELPYGPDGRTDLSALAGCEDIAAVAVQSPNFFGCIEDIAGVSEYTHGRGCLTVAAFTEPLAYGLLKSPGAQGADIVCGEGRSMGLPMSLGGSSLGMFASKMEHVRRMPGRIVGKTADREGRRGFVVTLATREQHIRRERATSNICTNQSLCALGAAMYMSSLGKTGIRELAKINHDKAEYLKSRLGAEGFGARFDSPTFNEFVVEFPGGFDEVYDHLLDTGIVAGLPLGTFYPELGNCCLMCATETRTKDDIDTLVEEIATCMKR